MIRVQFHVGDSMSVTVQGHDPKSTFEELSVAMETFGQGCMCEACGSKQTVPVTRVVSQYTLHEWRCTECWSTLKLSSTASSPNNLFPARKKDGEWLPNKGWVKWEKGS